MTERQSGRTTNMLLKAMGLIPELIQEYPVLIIAHDVQFAERLGTYFDNICTGAELRDIEIPERWSETVVKRVNGGMDVFVANDYDLDNNLFIYGAKFEFRSTSHLTRNVTPYYREIFMDHFCLEQGLVELCAY